MKRFASSEQKVRRRVSPVQSKELQADARRQLLERRPDILQAEQLLRSANAQVGESLAESFPKIGLTVCPGSTARLAVGDSGNQAQNSLLRMFS